MLTIKEYAKQNNVSYESVRKQIKRYNGELNTHIEKIGRTQYLDDFAVDFLDEKRQKNPVIVLEKSKDEEIERLTAENKMLLLKVAELQDSLLKEKDAVKQLQQEKIELLEQPVVKKEEIKKSLWDRLVGK